MAISLVKCTGYSFFAFVLVVFSAIGGLRQLEVANLKSMKKGCLITLQITSLKYGGAS